jgi:hypothetical protein
LHIRELLKERVINGKKWKIISEKIIALHKIGHYDGNRVSRGPMTSDTKLKISETLRKKYEDNVHHLTGVSPWNKGEKLHYDVWNKGRSTGPMSPEQKSKISAELKERYADQPHHLKGRVAHNKGRKTGKPAWNAGKPAEKFTCKYCGKEIGGAANYNRWHNDNCKHKQ